MQKRFSDYQNIIWDFNGTLINDGTLNLKLTNLVLEQRKMKPLSFEEYKAKICFPITNFYKNIGLPFEGDEYDKIVVDWTNLYEEEFLKCPLQENALTLIIKAYKKDRNEYILSALHQDLLNKAIVNYGIKPFIIHAQGVQKYDGPTKINEGKELIKNFKIDLKETIMIGDTLHDLEVAEILGIDSVIMAHGHQDKETLSKSNARVINNFNDSFFNL